MVLTGYLLKEIQYIFFLMQLSVFVSFFVFYLPLFVPSSSSLKLVSFLFAE